VYLKHIGVDGRLRNANVITEGLLVTPRAEDAVDGAASFASELMMTSGESFTSGLIILKVTLLLIARSSLSNFDEALTSDLKTLSDLRHQDEGSVGRFVAACLSPIASNNYILLLRYSNAYPDACVASCSGIRSSYSIGPSELRRVIVESVRDDQRLWRSQSWLAALNPAS
jgi:hypothetical protein